ncbi:hypothetical protein GE21DRAFT_1034824 [Neurospora crassa]|nr:hypothetical protein GE21DRAFT_1034824 [Neurospora crassa]
MAAGRNQPSVISGSGELFGWYSNLRNRNPDLHNARCSVLLLLPVCFARCAISVRQGPGLVVALVWVFVVKKKNSPFLVRAAQQVLVMIANRLTQERRKPRCRNGRREDRAFTQCAVVGLCACGSVAP